MNSKKSESFLDTLTDFLLQRQKAYCTCFRSGKKQTGKEETRSNSQDEKGIDTRSLFGEMVEGCFIQSWW